MPDSRIVSCPFDGDDFRLHSAHPGDSRGVVLVHCPILYYLIIWLTTTAECQRIT